MKYLLNTNNFEYFRQYMRICFKSIMKQAFATIFLFVWFGNVYAVELTDTHILKLREQAMFACLEEKYNRLEEKIASYPISGSKDQKLKFIRTMPNPKMCSQRDEVEALKYIRATISPQDAVLYDSIYIGVAWEDSVINWADKIEYYDINLPEVEKDDLKYNRFDFARAYHSQTVCKPKEIVMSDSLKRASNFKAGVVYHIKNDELPTLEYAHTIFQRQYTSLIIVTVEGGNQGYTTYFDETGKCIFSQGSQVVRTFPYDVIRVIQRFGQTLYSENNGIDDNLISKIFD